MIFFSYYIFLSFQFASAPVNLQVPYPFKVLQADSAVMNGEALTPGQSLDNHGVIVNHGHMILIHNTGNLIEFVEDSVIRLQDVINNFRADNVIQWVKDPAFIFGKSPEGPTVRNCTSVKASVPRLSLIYPACTESQDRILLPESGKLCLWWRSLDEGFEWKDYLIEITNVWDEEIAVLPVSGNIVEIDLTEFSTNAKDERYNHIYLINVRESAIRFNEISPVSVELVKEGHVLSPCNATESVEWLQIAIWLEYHGYISFAGSFFKKAAGGSEKAFYEEMLQLFNMRNNL